MLGSVSDNIACGETGTVGTGKQRGSCSNVGSVVASDGNNGAEN